MTDAAKGKRTYTVLKATPENLPDLGAEPEDDSTAGSEWISEGEFDASSDKQAIQMAMQDGDHRGGVFVAIPRFNPRTVAVKPVTATRLEWS